MLEYERKPADGELALAPEKVKVIGIGGAGSNVLDRIALHERMDDGELLVLNTDVRDLVSSVAEDKIQLGKELTQGLGAGGDPDLGKEAAQKTADEIRAALEGKSLVFICAGLGGGTGSGAAPVVAKIAREVGAFVVGFVTMPFSFEGRRRLEQAESALVQMEKCTNALMTFDNDRMGSLINQKEGIQQAFAAADQIIGQSVGAITKLVAQPGLVRIGMDDLLTALKNESSRCLFGFGQASGDNRAQEALKAALKNPLLDRGQMLNQSSSLIAHISGGETTTLWEVEILMNELSKYVNDDAHILFGVSSDKKQGESLSLTIISSIGKAGSSQLNEPVLDIEDSSEIEESIEGEGDAEPEFGLSDDSDKEDSVFSGEVPEPFISDSDEEDSDEEDSDEEDSDEEDSDEEDSDEEDSDEEDSDEDSQPHQQDLIPEKKGGRGRFDKVEPTVTDEGEDLDVPSFLRKKKK
ncbi:MAG: cell division protein FtsZ [Verrucomicrobiales bacterium]|nr:cell division protein FtsZ [Verrucomicrobiales bacterium]